MTRYYNDEGALAPDQPVRTGGVDPDIAPVEVPDAAPAGDGGLREALWDAISDVRDAYPRLPNDADSWEIVDAVLAVLAGEQEPD